VNVFLLNVQRKSGGTRPLFYAEPHPDGHEDGHDPDHPVEKGVKGWAVARLRRLRGVWDHSEGRAAKYAHRAWDWLHSRTNPDEALLARLRSARVIEIHHAPSITANEAQAAWTAFLARARIRHWLWFLLNLVISPLTVLLAPLPGPNLIGYWFAYRAVHHWLILIGLGRARGSALETELHPSTTLENHTNPTHLSALGLDPKGVRAFLARHGYRHGTGVEDQQSTTP
jgi:Mitochondrial K+-H+ exchange-related